jgi:hypothetical protein
MDSGERRSRPWVDPAHAVDVLVYVVVLNLAIEYIPSVITEGFTLSLLTAVLLKLVLEVVVRLKELVVGRLRGATSTPHRVLAAAGLWVLSVGSKFVVLELTDLVFGGAVRLGGFVSVTLLIITLVVGRMVVRRVIFPDREAVPL